MCLYIFVHKAHAEACVHSNAGLATLIFPEALGGPLQSQGPAAAAEKFARQQNAILVMVLGYLNFIAGRNNAEWFFAGSALERPAAALLVLLLVLSGGATFGQVAVQVIVDLASAAYTYKLYQQDLADRQAARNSR